MKVRENAPHHYARQYLFQKKRQPRKTLHLRDLRPLNSREIPFTNR